MLTVKVQVNHGEILTLRDLWQPLYDEIGEENGIREEIISDGFEIINRYVLPDNSFVTIFTAEFPDSELVELRDTSPREVFISYLDSIKAISHVYNVLKINADLLKEEAIKYYKEIVDLEMDLRNIINYILTYDNKRVSKESLREFGVKQSENGFQDEVIALSHENALFYIYFSAYSRFSEPQKISDKKIIEMLQDVSIHSFEKFKETINNRAITEDRHTSFLLSIESRLLSVEKMRNTIMHIRNLSKGIIENYKKAVYDIDEDKGLKTMIKDFWENEDKKINEQTRFALAKSLIPRIVFPKATMDDGQTFYKVDDDEVGYGLEEGYIGLEDLKSDLIPYLQDEIVINNLDTDTEQFEQRIGELIEELFSTSEDNSNEE